MQTSLPSLPTVQEQDFFLSRFERIIFCLKMQKNKLTGNKYILYKISETGTPPTSTMSFKKPGSRPAHPQNPPRDTTRMIRLLWLRKGLKYSLCLTVHSSTCLSSVGQQITGRLRYTLLHPFFSDLMPRDRITLGSSGIGLHKSFSFTNKMKLIYLPRQTDRQNLDLGSSKLTQIDTGKTSNHFCNRFCFYYRAEILLLLSLSRTPDDKIPSVMLKLFWQVIIKIRLN